MGNGVNIGLCMKKTFSAVGCESMWQKREADMQRPSEEAKEAGNKSGKTEMWREQGRGLRSKDGVRIGCLVMLRLSWRVLGVPWVFRCVCACCVFVCACCACCACFFDR